MGQLAAEDVAEDLGVVVRVGGEVGVRRDAVFVEDAQAAEAGVVGGVVGAEGEGVVGVEPAVVGVAAGVGTARRAWGRSCVMAALRLIGTLEVGAGAVCGGGVG